ncbi:hypothetical protein DL767_007788 [Monosporascus sp. MG133]|nr:hypothetical protein DL767_007788 [Monosporascus sp. MG133]
MTPLDWYCALTEHLLNKNHIAAGNELQAVLHQLEERVVALYKALLLYQMKSDGDLKLVTDAEATVRDDAAQYFQERTKTFLRTLVTRAEGMEARLGNIQ